MNIQEVQYINALGQVDFELLSHGPSAEIMGEDGLDGTSRVSFGGITMMSTSVRGSRQI